MLAPAQCCSTRALSRHHEHVLGTTLLASAYVPISFSSPQMEQRTEAASQRMTLEDVEVEVQKVVRVEEQDRVEKELYEFQMKAMEDERYEELALHDFAECA